MRKNGFTLIELLVVTAIVAILASVLFPVFSWARAASHHAANRAEVGQVAQALEFFEPTGEDIKDLEKGHWLDFYRQVQYSGSTALGEGYVGPLVTIACGTGGDSLIAKLFPSDLLGPTVQVDPVVRIPLDDLTAEEMTSSLLPIGRSHVDVNWPVVGAVITCSYAGDFRQQEYKFTYEVNFETGQAFYWDQKSGSKGLAAYWNLFDRSPVNGHVDKELFLMWGSYASTGYVPQEG